MKYLFENYFTKHKKLFAIDILSAMFVAAIDLVFPIVTRMCLYLFIPEEMWKAFFITIGLMVAFYALRSIAIYNMWYFGHSFGVCVERDMRIDLFSHLQTLGYDFFDSNRTGQMLSRLTTDLFDITEMSHHTPEDILVSFMTIIGAIIIMFRMQWKLALTIAIALPIFLIIVIKNRKMMKKTSMEVKKKTSHINTEFEEAISAFKFAKAESNEAKEREKFKEASETYKEAKYSFYKAMGRFNASMEYLLCFLPLAVIGVSGVLIMKDGMDALDIITFNLYVASFVSPLRKLAGTVEILANGKAGLKRFREILDVKPTVTDAPDAIELKEVKGSITFENVNFSYDKGTDVLKDFSFQIVPGETVGICGDSGGGKTTLINLIPRFYDADSGQILIDGEDVRRIKQESLRKQIGLISQNVFLFASSIMENVRYSKPDATDEEVIHALELASLADDISKMPNGANTIVGENGVLLSGGQRQRIAIARTFLKNPPILILDEATSALDTITESKIQKTFERLSENRTTIVIAHRLSTIRRADRIVVISNGKIVETGVPDELMANEHSTFKALQQATNLNLSEK